MPVFHGIPSTQFIKDPETKRVLDAIIDNLRHDDGTVNPDDIDKFSEYTIRDLEFDTEHAVFSWKRQTAEWEFHDGRFFSHNIQEDQPDEAFVFLSLQQLIENQINDVINFQGLDRLVRVSAADIQSGYLVEKLSTPNPIGAGGPHSSNLALVNYITLPAANELLNLDFDLNRLAGAATSNTSEFMFSTGAAGGTHNRIAITDLVKNSIEINSGKLQLVNDAASPGNSFYYGTDSGGTKGLHALPASQNLWETITSDSGSTVANTPADTLTIAGGSNAETSITGDTVTVDVDVPGSGSGTGVLAAEGNYTGDGSTGLAITNIGFQPAKVEIWEQSAANNMWHKKEGMTYTFEHVSGGHSTGAGIVSLDVNGFTVATDGGGGPNTNTTEYEWFAIGASSSEVVGASVLAREGDGTNKSLTNSNELLGTGDFTVGAFVYLDTTAPGVQVIYSQVDVVGPSGFELPSLQVLSGGTVRCIMYNTADTPFLITANSTVGTGTWFHAVARITGTLLEMFINGVKQSSTVNFSGTRRTGDQGAAFFNTTGFSAYLDGRIAVGFVENSSLSDADITTLYQSGCGVLFASIPDPTLKSALDNYYDMTGASGASETDQAGSDNLTDNNTVGTNTGPCG